MSFGNTDIDGVRAMTFPAGQFKDGTVVVLSGLILVIWKSKENNKLFQVYVDGQFAGVSSHPSQRRLVVQHEHTHPAAIEVIWVTADDKYIDHSHELTGFNKLEGSHAELEFPRRGSLPLDSSAHLYWNAGSGEIDYSEVLTAQPVWPDPFDKWGWGTDAFGKGDFGFSSTSAPGLGRGSFGDGEFGFDADMLTFRSASLPLGTYLLLVRLSDAVGNLDESEIVECEISVDPIPSAPVLSIESYDEITDKLVLNIS